MQFNEEPHVHKLWAALVCMSGMCKSYISQTESQVSDPTTRVKSRVLVHAADAQLVEKFHIILT